MSRVYTDFKSMHQETERELLEMGHDYITLTVQDKKVNRRTKELVGYNYILQAKTLTEEDDKYIKKVLTPRGMSNVWLETVDRMVVSVAAERNPNRAVKDDWEFWKQFANENGKLAYTYPERIHLQLHKITEELKNRPGTRHAILQMYERGKDFPNLGGKKRVPCSMYYQFLIRDDKLHLIYNMRSCDYYTFFLRDVLIAWGMLQVLAGSLQLGTGNLYHQISSLHAFEEDLKGVF